MKKLILFCVAALFVGSAWAGKPAADMKLMSFNVRYLNPKGDEGDLSWDKRREPSIAMIRKEQPDVIGYQEPRGRQLTELSAALPEYGHVECGRDAGVREDGGEHLMVMWRTDKYDLLDSGHYWLSETPEVVSRGWDAKNRRVTVWVKLRDKATGKKFFYFDTHLDHIGKVARLEGAKLNVAQMQRIAGKKAAVFISGDMNAQLEKSSGAYVAPYFEWLKNARYAASKTDSKPTFNGFGKKSMALDYIFFRNAEAKEYRTITDDTYGVKFLSDHYPIVCTFEL